jgi:hypothetical protein
VVPAAGGLNEPGSGRRSARKQLLRNPYHRLFDTAHGCGVLAYCPAPPTTPNPARGGPSPRVQGLEPVPSWRVPVGDALPGLFLPTRQPGASTQGTPPRTLVDMRAGWAVAFMSRLWPDDTQCWNLTLATNDWYAAVPCSRKCVSPVPAAAGHAPARTRSWPTRRTRPRPTEPTCAAVALAVRYEATLTIAAINQWLRALRNTT